MIAASLVTVVLVSITLLLLSGIVWSTLETRRRTVLSWPDLLKRLQPVAAAEIQMVAFCHLHPAPDHIAHSPQVIWDTLGGVEGLQRMSDNAEVLIAMASYAQRWNPPAESILAAAQMQRDGIILRNAVRGLGIGAITSDHLKSSLYLHEAASAYYLMTERLMLIAKYNPMSISEALERTLYSQGSFG